MACDVNSRHVCFAPWASRRKGITLIELLAVIAILVVVIAILMPALSKVQRQARTLTCLSNLRQIHLAYNTYLMDNDEQAFPYDPAYHMFWLNAIRPLTSESTDLWTCPEASAVSYGWGNATTAWGPYDAQHGTQPWMSFLQHDSSSYGFNGWLYSNVYDASMSGSDLNRMPVFADANWVDATPRDSDPIPSDLSHGASPTGGDLGRFCLARHGPSVNVGFRDGHAEQVSLSSLWQLRWSKTFQPHPMTVPPVSSHPR